MLRLKKQISPPMVGGSLVSKIRELLSIVWEVIVSNMRVHVISCVSCEYKFYLILYEHPYVQLSQVLLVEHPI